MNAIEVMLTTRPWADWGAPVTPVAIPIAPPRELVFDERERARRDEFAAIEGKESHLVRCAERTDGKTCLRVLLAGDADVAFEAIATRPADGFCECSVEPALLGALGPRAFLPLLRRIGRRWSSSHLRLRPADALDFVEAIDTPLALGVVLPALLGRPTYETHHDEQRMQRARARRWLRRAGTETRALLRRVAAGEVPEALVGMVEQYPRPDALDPYPNLPACARAALRVLGESDDPVLLPIEHAPSDELWPATLELDGARLGDEARATLTGWLLRTEWCLPGNPGQRLAAACSEEGRRALADSFVTRWCATTDSAEEMLFVALAFGGADVARVVLDADRWVADSFKPRRMVKTATVHRCLGAVASSVEGAERAALLELLAAVGIDGRKKSATWRHIALAEIERCAEELGEPADTLDERHLPTLGFDSGGRVSLPYGTRTLTLSLDAQLALVVDDGTKKRATLPTAKKADDPKAIAAAKARFAELRSALKVYAEGAQARVRTWIRDGQRWRRRDFDAVVRHPILGAVANGLVLGEWDAKGALVRTFRVAEDRSFADRDDTALEIAPDALVGPVHGGELDAATRTAWATIFHDYEIIPLFPQLEEPRAPTLDPNDPTRIFVGPTGNFWTHKVDDVSAPEGWLRLTDWQLLGEPVPEPDFSKRLVARWQRSIRDYRVKIECRPQGFFAMARRHGDFRLQWLRWDQVPPFVAHEVVSDIEEFLPRFG
jgi:hypothetical protein